jgi:hypothetical protein
MATGKSALDWTLDNGLGLDYQQNLALNSGYTPEMYRYSVWKAQQEFPDGGYEGAGLGPDMGAINYFRNSTPYSLAQEMAAQGLDIGDSPQWQAYQTRVQEQAPGRADFSFLDGYQPQAQAPAPVGWDQPVPETNYSPSFGGSANTAENPLTPNKIPLRPEGLPGYYGPAGSPGNPKWDFGQFETPTPTDFGGTGGTDDAAAFDPATSPWQGGSDMNRPFYQEQFAQLLRQGDNFQDAQAAAGARRQEAIDNPPTPNPSDWSWLEGGLPEIVTGADIAQDANYSWAEGFSPDMTNQQIFDAASPNLSQSSNDWLQEFWLPGKADQVGLGTRDPNTFAQEVQGYEPGARNAWSEVAGTIFDYSPAQGSNIPPGYASPNPAMQFTNDFGYQRGGAQYYLNPQTGEYQAPTGSFNAPSGF